MLWGKIIEPREFAAENKELQGQVPECYKRPILAAVYLHGRSSVPSLPSLPCIPTYSFQYVHPDTHAHAQLCWRLSASLSSSHRIAAARRLILWRTY
jgi:hypothetical protein